MTAGRRLGGDRPGALSSSSSHCYPAASARVLQGMVLHVVVAEHDNAVGVDVEFLVAESGLTLPAPPLARLAPLQPASKRVFATTSGRSSVGDRE